MGVSTDVIRWLLGLLLIAGQIAGDEPRRDRWGDELPPGSVARLGWRLPTDDPPPNQDELAAERGHGRGFYQVVIDPLGRWVATRGGDTRVRLWSLPEGEPLAILEGHSRSLRGMDVAPDGRRLLSVAPRDRVIVWDTQQHKAELTLPAGGELIQFVDEGRAVRLVDRNRIRDILLADGKLTPGHEGPNYAVGFSPDGRLVAAIPRFGQYAIRLVDATSNELVRVLEGSEAHPIALAFSPDGRTLAAGGRDEAIRWWEVHTGEPFGAATGHEGPVQTVAFSHDGLLLASGGWDTTVRVWDVANRQQLHVFEGHTGRVAAVAFSPDGQWLVSGSLDGSALIWSLEGIGAPPASPPLSDKRLGDLWADLAADDGPRAYRALTALAQHPDDALRYLGRQLEPVLGPRGEIDLAELVWQLNHDEFAIRQRASELLLRLRNRAESLLRARLAEGSLSPEQESRVRRILNEEPLGLEDGPEARRLLRVVHLLQLVGDDEARDLLEWIAADVPSTQVTNQAHDALKWLRRTASR